MEDKYGKIIINGMEFLYDCCRIKQEDVPQGYHKYSVRFTDDNEDYATIERRVIVNHAIDILSPKELEMGDNGIEIKDWTFKEFN